MCVVLCKKGEECAGLINKFIMCINFMSDEANTSPDSNAFKSYRSSLELDKNNTRNSPAI